MTALLVLPLGMYAQSAKQTADKYAGRFGLSPLTTSTLESVDADRDRLQSTERGNGEVIWEETFDNGMNTSGDTVYTDNGGWVRTGSNGDIWKYSTVATNGCWSGNTPAVSFTTASNGFITFDADSANCTDPTTNPPVFTQTVFTGSIESPIIDLTSVPNISLGFEYAERWCCTDPVFTVALSSDSGATWSNEYEIFHPDANVNLQGVFEQNVSNEIGGSAGVKIRFTWDAVSHYYLSIDDIQLSVPPSDDMRMNFAYVSHNGTGEEYGRIPKDQLQSEMLVGAEMFNFGSEEQSNVTLEVDFVMGGNSIFDGMASQATLVSLDTVILEDQPTLPNLETGVYTGEFTVTSDADTVGGDNFGNNTLTRKFSVTEALYSIDAIGVNAQPVTGSLGTNSFTDAEDGLMVLNYYDISATTTVIGLQILLDGGSDAGGSLTITLHDTANVFANDVTSFLEESDVYDITQQDVNSGSIDVMFQDPIEIEPNAYFVGVELFSNAGDNIIRIVDDLTVPQPEYSSMIYIPDDQVYTNGNAMGIRLMMQGPVGISEAESNNGVNIFPNPASDVLNVHFTENQQVERMTIVDVAGKLVSDIPSSEFQGSGLNRIDISGLTTGIYIVNVIGSNTVSSQKLIIE